jgi:hypothetical protein
MNVTVPLAVALLNYTSCGILWRNFRGVFSHVYSIYITGRISAAAMSGDIIFFSLAGPVGDYTGVHTVIFRGVFLHMSQWYSEKIYAPGSLSSGLKRSILFLNFAGFSLYIINFVRRISEAAMGGAGPFNFWGSA